MDNSKIDFNFAINLPARVTNLVLLLREVKYIIIICRKIIAPTV